MLTMNGSWKRWERLPLERDQTEAREHCVGIVALLTN